MPRPPRWRAGRGAPPSPTRPARPGRTRGQALVEFAIILPVFLLLLLAAVDFGRLFFSYIEVNNAAREGAAYGAGNPTDLPGITTRALQETNSQAQGGEGAIAVSASCADAGGGGISCASSPGGTGAGNTITVTARERFSFLTPFIGNLFGADFAMTASASSAVLNLAASGGTTPGACQVAPTAIFAVTASDLTVNLDASAATPNAGLCAISGYNWELGDGLNPFPPVTGKTVSYTYASAGTYTIQLTVTNQAAESTTSQTVVVGTPPPSPTPSPSPTATVPPGPTPTPVCGLKADFTWQSSQKTVTFQGSYTGQPAPDTWSWVFGDGGTGSGQNPKHDYANGSDKSVRLTISAATCSASVTKTVKP